MQLPPQPLQQQQQQPRFTRANSILTTTGSATRNSGIITGQVPLLRPPNKLVDSSNISLTSNLSSRNVKNVQYNLPAQSRAMSSSNNNNNNNAHARRLTMNNASLTVTSRGSTVRTSALDGSSQPSSLLQNSTIDASLSNLNDHVGSSRLGASVSQPPQFAVPNSSHHKEARVPSSPLRGGLSSSVPTTPSSTPQVLSNASMTQSLHLPNGLRTLPLGHPARTALLGNDRTRGSVTVVGTSAGVLGLSGPTAKGQESVTSATHLLGSSGSHVASKHLSSSS